jgi:hypothetical protein
MDNLKKKETYNFFKDIVAIVVDIRNNIRGVNIHSKNNSNFVDIVGIKEQENMVIVS